MRGLYPEDGETNKSEKAKREKRIRKALPLALMDASEDEGVPERVHL